MRQASQPKTRPTQTYGFIARHIFPVSRFTPNQLDVAEMSHYMENIRQLLPAWFVLFCMCVWLIQPMLSRQQLLTGAGLYILFFAWQLAMLWHYRRQDERTQSSQMLMWNYFGMLISVAHGFTLGVVAFMYMPDLPVFPRFLLTWVVVVSGAIAAVSSAVNGSSLSTYLLSTHVLAGLAWLRADAYEYWPVFVSLLLVIWIYDRVGQRHLRGLRERLDYARDLAGANRLLEQSNISKTRLIVEASHDLRQPVHALGLMLDRIDVNESPSKIKRRLTEAQSCVDTISDMLIDLLDLSRLEKGEYPVDLKPVDLGATLRDLEIAFQPMAQRKGLHWVIASTSVWVMTDPAILRRIMNNLISNAIKYTHKGGVSITCRAAGNDMVMVRVRDSGVGMAPDKIRTIFSEYVRLDDASQEPGYGIGLAVVKRMITLLGHRLRVTSSEGKGSEFSLSLPTTEAGAQDELRAFVGTLPIEYPFQGKLIIIIENDDQLRNSTVEVLAAMGAEVVGGTDIDTILESSTAAGKKPDLIISDMHLDGQMTGLEVISQFRQAYFGHVLPAILLTGDLSSQLEAQANAMDVYVAHKPVRPSRFREMMTMAIAGKRVSDITP
ncbi:MAG: hybrid sensor histidine kinase/response regulator [Comamonadaceae bacterium]|nr:MAG: hybrid sensor histidine kinase/response regulator [Comamonadaceae bacterium]